MAQLPYGEILNEWEDRLDKYRHSEDKAEKEHMIRPTDDNEQKYRHHKAIRQVMERAINVLRKSLQKSIETGASPEMFFSDQLTEQRHTLDEIVENSRSKGAKGAVLGDLRKICRQLNEAYQSIHSHSR